MPAVQELAQRIARYAEHRLPDVERAEVEAIERIHGGASRETYRVAVRVRSSDGAEDSLRWVLRRDPEGSLIETDRRNEFEAYRAFFGTPVPVPRPLWLEEDSKWLDRSFFVMEEVTGCTASPQALLMPPYSDHVERMGEQAWRILGQISRTDPKSVGLADKFESVTADACGERELTYWEGVIDEDEPCPQPIGRAAIRWLRKNPPPPAQKVGVVHADYRTGNFLVDETGEIRAILDWEMAHLGDPLEDLAWSINRTWCWARDDQVGGLLEREKAIRIWEESSGLSADPAALRWWEVLSSVKALAIWLSSGHEYTQGKNHDPVLAFTSWWLPNAQDRAILETLGYLQDKTS
jgi:aminoglycoside phosphotransferase (APT) family kinase protein